jgi:hypothetical protein
VPIDRCPLACDAINAALPTLLGLRLPPGEIRPP